ncbi:hypothetical protein MA16_Dca001044 [Dendrobium catenatum]|uniref:Tf2-1-like SH3-like domain-containing protein n=1 Tax=Dendrobium catenatum TaxID=906689 RepID=A0A2I0WLA8_9ASPA|nr:hypothetical protein MA16_Dca001044 [Dendrobium catenatum]
MTNRSTGMCPFSIVYTKIPNSVLDVIVLPKCKSKSASALIDNYTEFLSSIRSKIYSANAKYKPDADVHRREKLFKPGDLVLVRLKRERLPVGEYSKLGKRKWGPFPINSKINDNAYIIDLPEEFNTSHTFNVKDIYPYVPPDDGATQTHSVGTDDFLSGGE